MLKRNKLKFLWLYEARKKAGKGKNMFLISGFASSGATVGLSKQAFQGLGSNKVEFKNKIKKLHLHILPSAYKVFWVTRIHLFDRRDPKSQA